MILKMWENNRGFHLPRSHTESHSDIILTVQMSIVEKSPMNNIVSIN
jgi:hypothetical protein